MTFWPTAFRERHSGPKLIGSITTTNLLSVPSFFLSQFPLLATKIRSRESMAGRVAEAFSMSVEKKGSEGIRFDCHLARKHPFGVGLDVSLLGWGTQEPGDPA